MKKHIKYKEKKICIIGVGKVGSIFYHSLHESGYLFEYAVDSNYNRLKKIIKGDKKVKISDKIKKDWLINSDVIVFAVQEKQLRNVIEECRKFKLDLSNKILFHLSGIETSDLFSKLNTKKQNTGSFHPLQTFIIISYSNNKLLNSIYFGLQGGRNTVEYFIDICRSLNSNYIIIPKSKKILYHSTCVIASNFMVSHLNIISKMIKKISPKTGDTGIFKPIIIKTLENVFSQGIEKSLTGPFERGDLNTIKLHLKYFKENLPSQLYYYILSGLEALTISIKKKSITAKEAKEIERILLNYI